MNERPAIASPWDTAPASAGAVAAANASDAQTLARIESLELMVRDLRMRCDSYEGAQHAMAQELADAQAAIHELQLHASNPASNPAGHDAPAPSSPAQG